MTASTWTWTYEDADGAPLTPEAAPAQAFATQADAESWVGEAWHDLLAAGVEGVTLLEDGAKVYGPMSLRPAE